MKSALHVVLTIGLLLQGALAVAMPIPLPSTEASMPCHGGSAGKKSLPCCAQHQCACEAICSAMAPPVMVPALSVPMLAVEQAATRPGTLRAAFRFTQLRPPIARSA